MGNVRVGALERGGPCRGGGVEPSSEAVPARGGVELSSEADFARGGVKASSEADLARGNVEASSEADSARGSVYPSSDANPPEGAFVVPPWRAAGATRVVNVSRVCFRSVG
jgi:hypothetical protein